MSKKLVEEITKKGRVVTPLLMPSAELPPLQSLSTRVLGLSSDHRQATGVRSYSNYPTGLKIQPHFTTPRTPDLLLPPNPNPSADLPPQPPAYNEDNPAPEPTVYYGKGCFGIPCEQLNDPNKKPPNEAKVYKESRKRGSECKYKTDFKSIKESMKLSDLEAEYELGDGQEPKDLYYEVIENDEPKGRLLVCGRGVTKTNLRRTVKESYILPGEYMESIKSDVVSHIGPQIASTIIAQFQAANPSMNLVVPDFQVSFNHVIQVVIPKNIKICKIAYHQLERAQLIR